MSENAIQLAIDGSNWRAVRDLLIHDHYAYEVEFHGDVLTGYTGIQKYTDEFAIHRGDWLVIPSRARGTSPLVFGRAPTTDGPTLLAILNSSQHAPMETHSPVDGSCQECPWPLYQLSPEEIADVLRVELKIRDERFVKAEALREYARDRYEAYLTDPSLPASEQPKGMARQYRLTADGLLAEAVRLESGLS